MKASAFSPIGARAGEDSGSRATSPAWVSEKLTNALYQSRYLSDEGRLFFNSADHSAPGIANPLREERVSGQTQRVGVENVYEYEPAGVGSCGSAGGCVALISSGTSDRESAFLEATPSGNDVFFLTEAQLLAQDTDDAFDIYDARVCSASSPCLKPTPTPAGRVRVSRRMPCAGRGRAGRDRRVGQRDVLRCGKRCVHSPPKQEAKGVKATSPKPLTRAQKLTKALAACRKQHPHSKKKRLACVRHARKRVRPVKEEEEMTGVFSMRCRARDGGAGRLFVRWPSVVALQERAANHPKGRALKSRSC